MLRKVEIGLALLVTAIALVFATRFSVNAGPLWRDEAATWNFASQPAYGDLVRSLDFMSLPLLYPTIVRGWSALPWTDTDFAARLLGLLITIAMLAAAWLGLRALRFGPPLLTLAFFGLHGAVLTTAGMVRPYGLGALTLIGLSCAMLRLVLAPGRMNFAAAAIFATLAVHAQYQNTLFVAVICLAGAIAGLAARNSKTALLAVVAGVIAAVSLAPYVAVVGRGQEWRALHRSPADEPLAWMLQRLSDLLTLQNGMTLLLWLGALAFACYSAGRSLLLPMGAGADQNDRVARLASIYAIVTLFGTLTIFAVFFLVLDRIVQPWHVVPLIALLALSLDMIIAQTTVWPPIRLALALLTAIALAPAAAAMTNVRQTNVDLCARLLERRAAQEDLVVVSPWFIGITLGRYYHGNARVMTVPPIADLRIHRYDELRARMMERDPLRSLEDALTATLQTGHRVWIVGDVPITSQKPPPLPPAPHPLTGWSDATYSAGWSMQIGSFLQTHAGRAYRLEIPVNRPVNPYENVPMQMVEGWHN